MSSSSADSSSGGAAPKKAAAVVVRHETPTLTVDEARYVQLARFIPEIEVGHRVWMTVNATQHGQVMQAWVTTSPGGLEDIDATEPLDPRSAVRILKEVEGFETKSIEHLSIAATDGVFPSVMPKTALQKEEEASGSDDWTAMRKALPFQLVNDQFLLQKLEDFIESDAFTAPVRAFAKEHAHKIFPISLDDEQPLHYQELYLQYEKVLEDALEAYLLEHGSSVPALVECVKRSKERCDALRCIDLLLASSEYPAFVELMLDYKFDLMSDMLATNGTPDSVTSQAPAGLNVAGSVAMGAAEMGATEMAAGAAFAAKAMDAAKAAEGKEAKPVDASAPEAKVQKTVDVSDKSGTARMDTAA